MQTGCSYGLIRRRRNLEPGGGWPVNWLFLRQTPGDSWLDCCSNELRWNWSWAHISWSSSGAGTVLEIMLTTARGFCGEKNSFYILKMQSDTGEGCSVSRLSHLSPPVSKWWFLLPLFSCMGTRICCEWTHLSTTSTYTLRGISGRQGSSGSTEAEGV